jgi:hypothetical protein
MNIASECHINRGCVSQRLIGSIEENLKKKQRAPLISGRPEWIALEIFTLFVSTVVYTVIIWQDVSASAQTTLEAFKATVKEVVPFSQFALIYIIGTFELGGEIMIRFTSKIEQALEQGRKKGVEEGIKRRP